MLRIKTKRQRGVLWGLGAALCAVVVFGAVLYNVPSKNTNAEAETIVTGSPAAGRVNQQIAISGITINGTGNDIIPVKLQVTEGSLYVTISTGLTFTGATTGSTISFSGTRSDVNAALATLHYSGTTVGSQTLTVSLSDQNTIYNPTNGHVYQYIPNSGDWFTARDAAAESTYQGIPGYLATITSEDENNFIKDRLHGDAWLGASDDDQYMGEGHWSWIAGPEAGENFYNGEGSGGLGGGAPVDGAYTNWAGPDSEPNSAGNEDCMETYISDGTWNDLSCSDMGVGGYVVEYGDDTTNPTSIPTADVAITTTAATFAGGDGTPEAPYQVTDCEHLQDLNQDLSANYVLTHNIDCTDTPNWNGGQGFVPIGTNNGVNNPFTGTIQGAGYTIDGLTEIRADDDSNTTDSTDPATNQDYVGLIGYGWGSTINQLHLTNAKIKGYEYVGGLVGFMSNGTITDSSVNQGLDESSDTSCTPGYCIWARYGNYGGGLVGYMVGGSISDGTVGGLVKGSGNVIGGLVGYMEGAATITDSGSTAAIDGGRQIGGAVGEAHDSSSLTRVYATGDVKAKYDDEVGKPGYIAGGLVGYATNISIIQSYATGEVHADYGYVGGLVGQIDSSTITDAYATGDAATDDSYAGGLLGTSAYDTINRAYASGSVHANNYAGGLIGVSNQDTISDSFAAGATSGNSAVAAFLGDQNSFVASQDYYDINRTGQESCDPYNTASCIGVNSTNSQPTYLVDYTNAPFTQSSSRVWDEATWYFDGASYPVLRMGNNSTASVRPFVDDNDGIAAAVENAAPNNGDGNNDGTLDSEQANVVSFVNPVTSKYVTLEVDDACSITAATSTAEPTNGDSNYSYPFGLVNYTVDCGTPGFSTNVKILYHNLTDASGLIVRKYNSTTNTYATIPSAVISGTNPVQVTYTIKDGTELDEDGTPNGIIVDPVGLAASQDTLLVGAPNTGIRPRTEDVSALVAAGIGSIVFVGIGLFIVRRVLKNHNASTF